jgi:uncharacterized membrane protein
MERTSIWPLLIASAGIVVLAAVILTAPDPRLTRRPDAGVSEVVRAEVVEVLERGTRPEAGVQRPYAKLRIRVESGSIAGATLEVEERALGPTDAIRDFSPGDTVLVNYTRNPDGNDIAYIAEYVRTPQLAWLALIFAVAIGLVGGFQGLRSLLGMAISFIIILRFIVPHILNGESPVLISVAGALLVLVPTLFLSHGFNAKTTAALAGTVVALVLTGVLGQTFITWTRLTGLASEEVTFLSNQAGALSFEGLLLGGLIIATLGVLDDVAVSQSSVVFELRAANSALGATELIRRAMRIGRDHIASTVNTLFLVYAGSSLPLLLLLSTQPEPLGVLLNREHITVEIVSALVGSIGLIAAVPLTTAAAALAVTRGWTAAEPLPAERRATHTH